jgi:hypothetical protein
MNIRKGWLILGYFDLFKADVTYSLREDIALQLKDLTAAARHGWSAGPLANRFQCGRSSRSIDHLIAGGGYNQLRRLFLTGFSSN